MTKKMLIDATHAEETRVAVIDKERLIDFDYESKVRKQLKGSIFLAKVTRVEPSLQAAFVNFGGNRHGFLPFSEIHPDYFRIPISDREAILAEQEKEMAARQAEEEKLDQMDEDDEDETDTESEDDADIDDIEDDASDNDEDDESEDDEDEDEVNGNVKEDEPDESDDENGNTKRSNKRNNNNRRNNSRNNKRRAKRGRSVEHVGGDSVDTDRPLRPSFHKNYKIQEVVKRGQIMLIQVSKEERGNKGAAVTSIISLPGRYCVLMPNSPRAGGVSRKIANFKDRKRMREILNELNVPEGMSVILRTAGVERTKAEIKRDLDYLLKLWDNVRELTLNSTAPAVVHEEGHLTRRSIRDIYSRDIEEIIVAGEAGYKNARDIMKMMIPSHAKKVIEYKDDHIPLFQRYHVENQINEIGLPEATLPSGGYLVINPTEALVSIDVNSGRATKERHIEETALNTNMEAAEEVARQLKLRDLGGLVVIDFIDMEDRRNNRKVEQKLKRALSTDRARIQVGRISSFGLLELSRQRLNPSLTEAQFVKCDSCHGIGYVRSIDSTAIMAIRALEEAGVKGIDGEVVMKIPNAVAVYILNHKRDALAEIEKRYKFHLTIEVAEDCGIAGYIIEHDKSAANNAASQSSNNNNKSRNNNNRNNDNNRGEGNADKDGEESGNRKSGRRRGRRGGRRRNNQDRDQNNENTDNNQNPAENKQDDGQDQNTNTENQNPASEKDTEDKKPSRRRSSRSKQDDNKEVDAQATQLAQADTAEADTKEQPKKKTTRKPKAAATKANSKKDNKTSASDDTEVKKTPAKKTQASSKAKKQEEGDSKKTETSKSQDKNIKASNDTGEQAAKDYETVNEAPKDKKKGWWHR